ncbi:MAG TPA: hypothetical protein VIM55_00075, partial [Mucilaginibacter sp.]
HYAGETISFSYTPVSYHYLSDVNESIFGSNSTILQHCANQNCPSAAADNVCFSDLLTSGVILTTIITPFERVQVGYQSRQDVAGDELVSQVDFYKKSVATGSPAKYQSYTLNYTTTSNSTYHNGSTDGTLIYRPFLTSVVRQQTGMQTETHSMSYYSMNGFPSRLSFAQDYWGYFNGVNNQHLVPPNSDPAISPYFPTGLADRTPNGSYSYFGLLSTITYPTQGMDHISYEPNTVYTAGPGNHQVGGVRVYQNVSSPVTGSPLTKTYIYAALDQQTQSSGRLRAVPDPNKYYSLVNQGSDCGAGDGTLGICQYNLGSSKPQFQLTYYTGGHICYDNVIVLRDATWANGGVEHQYETPNPGQDAQQCNTFNSGVHGNFIPGSPITNYPYPPGVEKLSRTFINAGQNTDGTYRYTTVQSVATENVQQNQHNQINYVVRRNWFPIGVPGSYDAFTAFDWMSYTVTSNWVYADKVTTTNYDLNGANPVSVVKTYAYNADNLLLKETTITGSDNKAETTDYKYPNDFTGTTPYDDMIAANDIDHVIEQLNYKDGTLLEGVKNDYLQFGTGTGVFQPSIVNTKTTGNYEPRLKFYDYNTSGGLLSQSKIYNSTPQASGPLSSYIWGYSNLLPIAQVKNAATNEIFYENFEFVTGTSVTSTAHTGSQAWNGSYTVPFSPPGGKNYVVTWFQYNATTLKWDYHREAYTGSKTFSGVIIDDVAVYPADAQMSMVAYDPSVGPTGMIDAKGETTTYSYDNYKRLTDIKDRNGNIVKHYDYHLADPSF